MQKFLNKSKGAQKTANGAAKKNAEGRQKPRHIKTCVKFHGALNRLQGAYRTTESGGRTGITVEARRAKMFPLAGIKSAAKKIFHKGIAKSKCANLNYLSL